MSVAPVTCCPCFTYWLPSDYRSLFGFSCNWSQWACIAARMKDTMPGFMFFVRVNSFLL